MKIKGFIEITGYGEEKIHLSVDNIIHFQRSNDGTFIFGKYQSTEYFVRESYEELQNLISEALSDS